MKKNKKVNTDVYKIDVVNQTAKLFYSINDNTDLKNITKPEGFETIVIEGKLKAKRFIVDNQVIKPTKYIGKVPIQGITEEGELVDLIGKFIRAFNALKELWLSIKRLF